MRKNFRLFLAFVVALMSSAAVYAADYEADLEAEMFKAWTSNEPGAEVVADPEPEPKAGNAFGCSYTLYTQVDPGALVYGHPNVYYLWYADLTGTKTMTVTGTPGMSIRLMLNREPYVEGGTGDLDGGAYVELIQQIGDDGTTVFDFTSLEYVHLNAIKLPWSGTSGIVKSIKLFGSVKPVSGWVDMLNNGDLEGTDLESFPVSKDGPNNGETANDRPEIVELNGVKCMKVTADDLTAISEDWTKWSTQFYFKFAEMLEEGTKWRMTLDVLSSEAANITTSAQGAPRKWQSGFIDGFDVWNDWQQIEKEGTVTAENATGNGGNGFGSIAFDLNNSNKPIDFYFKNAHFYIFKEKSPLSQVSAGFNLDVVRIDFGAATNLKDMVKAAGKDIIYPNDCVTVKVNGENATFFSVEGRADGMLYIFIDEGYPEDETAKVEVSFKNPADESLHLKYTEGRWEGEDVPDFYDLAASFTDGLDEYYSYLAAAPVLEKADPEDGSFNLPQSMKEFKVWFVTEANAEKIKATLGNEVLAVSPSTGFSKEFTFTRTSDGDIVAGEHILSITEIWPVSDYLDVSSSYDLTLNFGPVVIDPNDQPKDIVPVSYFSEVGAGGIPVGYNVKVGDEIRQNPNTYGSNACIKTYSEGGDFTRALYFRQDYVTFGEQEAYPLELEGGKSYTFHFNTARWKASGQYTKFEIFAETLDSEPIFTSDVLENNPDVNGAQNIVVTGSTAFDKKITIENTGKYILKWTCTDASGAQGSWNEMLLGNAYVKYVPNNVGAEETQLLNTALENAKSVLNGNADSRYDGADYDALAALIAKIEGEKDGYTAPSVFKAQAAALDETAKALTDHHSACDSYDANIKKTVDLVRQVSAEQDNGKPNEKNKFMATETFANLTALTQKYHASSQWVNVAEEGEDENWQLTYVFDLLKDNDQLAASNAELSEINTFADKMFTVGASKTNMTGYAVANERIRLGIELLKSLGVAEDDPIFAEANSVLGDDDGVAEKMKQIATKQIYEQLKEPENTLFAEVVDEQTLESTTPSYDLSLFVKNPNLYRVDGEGSAIVDWVINSGNPGTTLGWSQPDAKGIPGDAMISNWGGAFNVSQTITDLPAGIYTITGAYGERNAAEDAADTYFYVKTSSDSLAIDAPVIGQSYPGLNLPIEDVVISDGHVTIGVQAGGNSHVFFDRVQVTMIGALSGFNYADAYQKIVETIETGIDIAPATAKVRAIEIYSLDGRRTISSKKGFMIIKKYMSDGTVRTEKVVRK